MESNQKSWYVLRAIGGKEKKAKENIEAEVARRNLGDLSLIHISEPTRPY